ncbi:MAG TPA: hypothetical protein VGF79_03830, partial [Bacteroidia bacterium]
MKKSIKILSYLLTGGILLGTASCKKDGKSVKWTEMNNVIIGCKTGGTIVAAIDPIVTDVFAFKSAVDNNIVAGPACISDDMSRYYVMGEDKKIDEIKCATGEILRSFEMPAFASEMCYDKNSNRLLCISSTNLMHIYDVFEVSLSTGIVSKVNDFESEFGLAGSTTFIRNGVLHFLDGMKGLNAIDLSLGTITQVKSLSGVTNNVVYDGKNDKVYYMHSPNYKDFTLCVFDFANNTDQTLKNYPEIKTYLFNSAA